MNIWKYNLHLRVNEGDIMKKKIICLGDSLTQGYNIDYGKSWPEILSKKFNVINKGISGDTTIGMLSRYSKDVLEEKPSHIIVMGGTNDLYFNWPINQVLSNIVTMTRQSKYNDIQMIIGLPPISYNRENPIELYLDGEKHSLLLDDYREKLKTLCEFEGHSYIDFNEGLSRYHFFEDGLHPTEEGHNIMALNVLKILDNLIGSN
jgi:lysophospholipase L1-like esterase